MGQAEYVAGGIYLPLALVQPGVHLGDVGFPFAAAGAFVEGVGVGVDGDAAELAHQHAREHLPQMLIFARQPQIGPDLRAGIPQPHSVDVAGDDEGIPRLLVVFDGGVDGVGEAVGEHPGELGVGQFGAELGYGAFDGFGAEAALFGGGAVGLIFLGLAALADQQAGGYS